MSALSNTQRWMLDETRAGNVTYNGNYLIDGEHVPGAYIAALTDLTEFGLIRRVLDAAGTVPVVLTDVGKEVAR